MKQYNFTDAYCAGRGCVMVLGCFDGLHRAHQKLITEGFDISEMKKLPLVVWALNIPRGNKLMSEEDKISMLGRLGADSVITERFEDIRDDDCKSFVNKIINEFGARHIVCGYNFTFGQFKSGDSETLKRLASANGVGVTVMPKIAIDEMTISSTAVRNALTVGNPVLAGSLLGRFYEINGVVEHGAEKGRTIGFPTANISIMDGMIVPRFGVYRTFVDYGGKRYLAITNIGVCPSVRLGDNRITVETHLIDNEIDLYGQRISVKLASFIRGEKKFASLEELKEAIKEDVECAKKEYELK